MFNMVKILKLFRRVQNYRLFFILHFIILGVLSAEEVGKFTYTGTPENLQGDTLVLPEKVVAMSEFVHVNMFDDSMSSREKNSIFFVIDNSGSMTNNPGTDREGSRFTVTRDLIDSIYNIDPKMQVGLVIFGTFLYFDPKDDSLFVTCPVYDTGAYIPLLTLDSTYNGKKGYDILKFYLKTHNTNGYLEMEYTPLTNLLAGTGTNITAGFEAAKHGMKSSPYDPDKHFIIFLSDGNATAPVDPSINPYDSTTIHFVKGEKVPTSFTVYFTSTNSAPAPINIVTMTNNIKKNNYSSSNPFSNLWSIETSYDSLMNLLMTNVIGKMIMQNEYLVPFEMKANAIDPIKDWDSLGFAFKELFGLTGKITDFNFNISYKLFEDSTYFDSATSKDTTVFNNIKDTIHDIDFQAEITDGANIPNLVDIQYWGRNLEFYHADTVVNLVDETMGDLEIRFSDYKVDTLYEYEDVKIIMTHEQGSSKDEEEFELTDTGPYFSHTFKRKVAKPIIGDKKLQHQNPDEIIAIFRNPKLLLDTLVKKVPYRLSSVVDLHKAIYFDNNADGYIDSLYLGILGQKVEKNAKEILDLIEFPSFRNFTIVDFKASPTGIGVTVREDDSNYLPKTNVTSEDKLVINDTTILAKGGMLLPSTIIITDSVAPVINKAHFTDSLKLNARDELTIEFSEQVEPITPSIPFRFYSIREKKGYEAELSVISQDKKIGVFGVIKLIGATSIEDRDSIRINWEVGNNVYDSLVNNQANPKNVRRELKVTKISALMRITKGIYFDNDANGFVDSIFIGVNGDSADIKENAFDMLSAIELPSFRKFDTTNCIKYYVEGGFSVVLHENATTPTTYCTDEDFLKTKYTVLPQGGALEKGKATIYDSIAPVIHWDSASALLIDYQDTSISDTLRVKFSEKIQSVNHIRPFHFITTSSGVDQYYIVKFTPLNHIGDIMNFKVVTIESTLIENMNTGDSIWINESNSVSDRKGNYQDNINNIKRNLTVVRKLLPIVLIPNTVTPLKINEKGTLIISQEIIQSLDPINQKELNASKDKTTQGIKGIMITVVPQNPELLLKDFELKGIISLFDPVGNTVFSQKKMGFHKKTKSLIFFWDGRNIQGRFVGANTYLARIQIKEVTPSIYPNDIGPVSEKRIFIGVAE